VTHDQLYFGELVAPHGDGVIDVENPATEEIVGSVPRGDAIDVDRAVDAARSALPAWASAPRQTRQALLRSIADVLRERADANARVIVSELGMPIDAALSVQALEPATIFDNYADEINDVVWKHALDHSLIVQEPVGVVEAINP
jgi:aldehyde dehydrogenase (NAD+)